MTSMLQLLGLGARYGRSLLVAGLLAGIALPDVALAMKPWLPELVAFLLFVAALRIGPRQALGTLRELPVTAGLALLFQLATPRQRLLRSAGKKRLNRGARVHQRQPQLPDR